MKVRIAIEQAMKGFLMKQGDVSPVDDRTYVISQYFGSRENAPY